MAMEGFQFLRNDRLMVSLNVILRHNASILNSLLFEKIYSVGLLQQGITHVLFVFKYLPDSAVMPAWIATGCQNAVVFQTSADSLTACTFKIFTKNTFDDFRLFCVNDEVAIRILVISEKAACIDHNLALLKAILHS